MEVILTEDVKDLGLEGELHEVADGYARNYLFPKQRAVHATSRNKERYRQKQEKIEERRERKIEEARERAEDLDGVRLTLEKSASEEGSLYGSVSQEDIIEHLHDEGFTEIDPADIVINEAIREIGEHTVLVDLTGSVRAELEVEVAPN